MDTATILQTLSQETDSTQQNELRHQARQIIETKAVHSSTLPDALLDLLTTVIKPLFTASKHPALTSAGRKNLVSPAPTVGRFNSNVLDEAEKEWKNGWTIDLLKYIITSYGSLPETSARATLESHFHHLIPPILNTIDDGDTTYKAHGCQLLRLLCESLERCHSDMLKRTGLTEVFIDALKPNFMLLPTLTPEEDSLLVLRQLYPAFRALVSARYTISAPPNSPNPNPTFTSISTNLSKTQQQSDRDSKETTARQAQLTLLLRHGLLASLNHLSAGSSTTYLPLTTYLVSQLAPTIPEMGINAVVHLQNILPLLRNILCDPFGSAAPELLHQSLNALEVIIEICAPRIKAKWWGECLRGIVGCWCTVYDDEGEVEDEKRLERLQEVKAQCQRLAARLGDVVGDEEYADAVKRLVEEEGDLKDLFTGFRIKSVDP